MKSHKWFVHDQGKRGGGWGGDDKMMKERCAQPFHVVYVRMMTIWWLQPVLVLTNCNHKCNCNRNYHLG